VDRVLLLGKTIRKESKTQMKTYPQAKFGINKNFFKKKFGEGSCK
jgi:hypothetical protein